MIRLGLGDPVAEEPKVRFSRTAMDNQLISLAITLNPRLMHGLDCPMET